MSYDSRLDYFKKRYDRKTRTYKYRSREIKSQKLSKDFYNTKGQVALTIEVTSFKKDSKNRRTLIRQLRTLEEVVVEESFISQKKKQIVENAKLQALYSHYRKRGDIDLINDTKRLKNEIVRYKLIDYMIRYDKGYNKQLKSNRIQFKKEGNELIVNRLSEKDNKFEFFTSAPKVSLKRNLSELSEQTLTQEDNYSRFIN